MSTILFELLLPFIFIFFEILQLHSKKMILNVVSDLQRKVKEYEQKKEVLKRKSECFTQLLDMAKKDSMPDAKRSRSDDNASPVQMIFANAASLSNSDVEEGYGEEGEEEGEDLSVLNSDSVTRVRTAKNDSDSGVCIEFENESRDVNEQDNYSGESDGHSQPQAAAEEEKAPKIQPKVTKVSERVRKMPRPRRSTQSKEFVSSEDITE